MITKLKLTNFKNFRQAEVAFGPVSMLIGANATGKSNIRDALLTYRLKGSTEARVKALSDIPELLEATKNQDIARLHESSWMEQTMEFSEGTPQPFAIDEPEAPEP